MKKFQLSSVTVPAIALAGIAVSACTQHFDKPGMSKQLLARDTAHCMRAVTDVYDTYGGPIKFKGRRVSASCMSQLGYKASQR